MTVTDKTAEFAPGTAMSHGSTYTVRLSASLVQDAAGNANADTSTTDDPITNNVQMAPAPTVSSIVFTSDPGDDDTYGIGDTIRATVTFSATVTVTGTPQLELNVGGTAKQADYASGSGSAALVFSYIVAENDEDTDGVAIGANKLTRNGGTIKGGDGTGPDATLTHDAVDADDGHQVDGVRPTFMSAETSADGSTFSVTFSEPLQQVVGGGIIFVYENGSYSASHSVFSSETVTDRTVEIKLNRAMAHGSTYTLQLGTDVVRDAAGNQNADTGTTEHPMTNNVQMAPTVSGIEFTSQPGDDDTYGIVDTVQATVTFSGTVTVTGTPQLELDVGGAAKQADYASGTGSAALVFSYTVLENDEDTNGLAVGANKLTLNEGTIKGGDGTGPDATLTHDAVDADAAHKVDGVRPTFVSAETSADGSTFSVTFSEPLRESVDTDPIVVHENGSVSSSRSFFTSVTVTDRTVEFKPNLALAHGNTYIFRMSAGLVRDAAGNANAGTGTTDHPITNNVQMAPTVSGIEFTSQPGDDDTYGIVDTVQATVTFSGTVTVTGTPQLELDVGGAAKQADYASGSGSADLVFSYTVLENDEDTNGLAVGANKLTLNEGAIKGGDGTGPDATLTHNAVDADAGHQVDGVRPTFVSAETSADGSTFSVTFSEAIRQEVGAQIAVLENGSGIDSYSIFSSATVTDKTVEFKPRNATFAHGSTYTLQLGPLVRDAAGNANASTVPTQHPMTNNVQMAQTVSSIVFTSDPGDDDTYGIRDAIEVTVTFSGTVTVTGAPRLELDVGGTAKQADYASGSGSAALVFSYIVAENDEDTDGVASRGEQAHPQRRHNQGGRRHGPPTRR